ncbi:MDR family MFS transporter [Lysinibacillus sp. 3P01SB]|uniref:MDR family MFS transporter n=1 Tax=Lysinibacillus sp. 3P01SB TaxID=3132284 RepID=UPI0039A75E93
MKIRLIGETLFNLLYWMYFPFLALYFSQAIGLSWAGLMMMVPPLISLIGNIIGGNIADTAGRRPVMLIGASIQACMFALFALSSSSLLDYIAFLGISIGGALYKPASDAMVADLVEENHRKEVFATFITFKNIGAVLGPVIGAILFFEYRIWLLWSCSVVLFLYTAVIFIAIEETMPQITNRQRTSILQLFIKQLADMKVIMRDRAFMYYILAGIFSVVAIMQLDLYLAVYVTEHVPLQTIWQVGNWLIELGGAEVLGWMLGLNGVLFVLFILPVTKWLKKWTDQRVFILSCLLAGFGMFAVGFTTNFWLLCLLTVVFTFGEIVRAPVLYHFVSRYAPEQARAQYMGLANMQFTIGRMLAPITVFLSTWLPSILIFSVILCSALISMVLYLKLFKIEPEV